MASINLLIALMSLAVTQAENSFVGGQWNTVISAPNSSEIYIDNLGYEYTQRWNGGLIDRQYLHPERRAVAWETHNHLKQIGLPDARPQLSNKGVDALGRTWQRDELGYPYYQVHGCGDTWPVYYQPKQREAAAWAREQYAALDWSGAVRNGVAGAIVRAFEGSEANSSPIKFDPELDVFRDAVHHAVVTGMNHAGSHEADLVQFQKLIEAGIEDAIIQGFNAAGKSPIGSLPMPNVQKQKHKPDQNLKLPTPAIRLPQQLKKDPKEEGQTQSIVNPSFDSTPKKPQVIQPVGIRPAPKVYSLPSPKLLD